MNKILSVLFFTVILSFSFFSCIDDEKISYDPSLSLEFSSDTIRIDTIFSGFGSATQRLKVYNRNNHTLEIETIELMGGGNTGFRMNVSGQAGDIARNVTIYKKDSLFIYIEVTVDPTNANSPLLIKDSIRFRLNGKEQFVQLEAIGQDAVVWKKKKIENDTILTSEKPFLIFDTLFVNQGVTLKIEKNAKLHFHNGACMMVNGRLDVRGTLEEPVVFRGDRYDEIIGVNYNNVPGQWGGIIVDSLSFNNYFEYAKINSTDFGIIFKHSNTSQTKATFLNTILHNSLGDVLSAVDCKITAANTLFSNGKTSTVRLIGGYYSFVHCTFGNYISWRNVSHDAGVIIGNVLSAGDNPVILPLQQCDFFNCIIAGSGSVYNERELIFQNKVKGVEVSEPFIYSFNNCLIKVKERSGNFFSIVWAKDPEFNYVNNKNKDQRFDFSLDSISPAINIGDMTYSLSLLSDLAGNSRIDDGYPDVGCYEWVKKDEE